MPGGAPCRAGDREAENPETPPCEDGLSAASAGGAGEPPPQATASGFPDAALASLPDPPSAMPPHVTTPHERAPLPGGMSHVRTKYERLSRTFFRTATSPEWATAFTHFGLSGLAMSDSLSWLDGGSGDGAFAGAVWRPPPGKRGAFLHARLVETGGRGVRVRRLGASRAGEIRLTRFLRNPAVTVEEMAAEAAARTAGRCAGRAVLAIQDTTVVTSQGGGGLYLHAVLAVDEDDGAILGLMHACFLARDAGRRSARGSRPVAEKESRRWLDGAGRAAEVGAKAARVTVIADRESDIFAAFALRPAATELVVRAAQDRSLGDGGRLFGRADALAEGGRARLKLPAKPGRPAREALVAVRFMAVELARPTVGVRTGLPKSVVLNLVDVREVDPPAGEGVHWRLLTTLPVADAAEAFAVADLYRRVRRHVKVDP